MQGSVLTIGAIVRHPRSRRRKDLPGGDEHRRDHWRVETEVTARLQEIMTRAVDRVWATAEREKATLRAAALMEGIGRVAEAH